ncbi:MAG TPA: 2-phospho-L-lactate transferase [Actinomycetota bacterium]|nr:2-phospho-L-lactate transferase [Actinomycetota bacterium]
MLVALAGGVGAGRFLRGLVRIHPAEQLVVIVNTGDDLRMHGLAISPDLDSVTYTLAGRADSERGWGLAGETWNVRDALVRLGEPGWFGLGDRDIATHLYRTRRLAEGATLSQVTAELCGRMGVAAHLLPMSDDRVETRVEVDGRDGPEDLSFQEWWVGRQAREPVREVRFEGVAGARPAPGVLDALAAADGILVCPSNPVVSIAPILAVPGVVEAVQAATCGKVAVTPIVAGAPVRGMADKLLPAWEVEVSARGVAGLYADLVDAFVLDLLDADQAEAVTALGLRAVVAPPIMPTVEDAAALAKTALSAL